MLFLVCHRNLCLLRDVWTGRHNGWSSGAQWTLCVEELPRCVVQCLCSQFSSLELEGASRRYSKSLTEYLVHISYSEVIDAMGRLVPVRDPMLCL